MSVGVPTGALIAAGAAARKAQERILERLRAVDATHPSRAVALDGVAGIQARMLARYVEAGVVRQAGEHRYFVDERKLADFEASGASGPGWRSSSSSSSPSWDSSSWACRSPRDDMRCCPPPTDVTGP